MISENIRSIKEKIAKAAIRSNRSADDIKLVAVSKRFSAHVISQAYDAGQTLFGENYIQEVRQKRTELPKEILFHFIGHLQTNKVKFAAETCTMIETVDRLKLAVELNKHLARMNKKMDILVQVNIGNDPNKSGVSIEDTEQLLIEINALPLIRVQGLMTMPPLESTAELTRPHFKRLHDLAEDLIKKELFTDNTKVELSMGMSADYHIAIEEGATIVRVGTAIFGSRPELK